MSFKDEFKNLDPKKLEILALILILSFAFFLRVYDLGNAPLWIDESISSMAAQNILEKGIPMFDSGDYYGGIYGGTEVFTYPTAFFFLFGTNEFNARFFSVIIGLLTVLLAYYIGKEYSASGGLIAALFIAVFYMEVFYSRQARHYQLFQFLFFHGGVFCLAKVILAQDVRPRRTGDRKAQQQDMEPGREEQRQQRKMLSGHIEP